MENGFLFDMDGVIVDTNATHVDAIRQFLTQHGVADISDEQLEQHVFGRVNREWIPIIFGELPADEIEQLGDDKEALFRQMYEPILQPLPGLVSFLEEAQKLGVALAVGTSAPVENADFVLDGLNLRQYFSEVITGKEVSVGKPDPSIYQLAASRVNVDPTACVVFEDSLSGVQAGLRAGAQVVGVSTTHGEDELSHCGRVIADFTDLSVSELINSLFANRS